MPLAETTSHLEDSDLGSEAGNRRLGWRRRIAPNQLFVHALLLCFFGIAWLLDTPITRAMDQWYNGRELNGELHQLIISLAQYGQPLGILAAASLIWIFDRGRRGQLILLAAVLLAAGLGSDILKALAGRVRPVDAEFVTIFQGPVRNLADTRTQSFPSGHTSTAFGLSYALALMYPRLRCLVWPLAVGVALNRILTVRHFPTDVIAGVWFGYFSAAWVSTSSRIARWVEWANERWEGAHLPVRGFVDQALFRRGVRAVLASPWLLVFACLAMYWAGNGEYGLWDRDEPRFATATREMIARGDWIVPTFNAELRPDKPILIYWLQRVSYWVFGDGPFAARFWSGIGGTIACLVTWRLGSAMFGRRVGLVSAWVLALSPMLIVESKLGTVDAILVATIVTIFYAAWRVYSDGGTAWTRVALWSAIGLGVLTKGPVAVVVPTLSIALFCVVRREGSWLRRAGWLWGPVLAAAIVLPWTVAVELATNGEFLSRAIGRHVVTRAVQPLENHSGFPGYYVLSVLGLMVPWSFLLPWAIWSHRKRFVVDARIAFLGSWALATLFLFEIIRTKLVHYYLPAYPAISILLVSSVLGSFGTASYGLRSSPRRAVGWGLVCGGGIQILAVALFALVFLPQELGIAAAVVASIGGLGTMIAGRMLLEGSWQQAFQTQAAVGVVTILLAGTQLLPRIHEHQTIVAVASRIREIRRTGESVALWRYRDPSLIHNVREVLPIVDAGLEHGPFEESLELAERTGGFVVPVTEEQLRQMLRDPSLVVSVRESVRQWDIAGLGVRTVHLASVRPKDAVASGSPRSRAR